MTETRKEFDLLLVIGYFRSALPMLSIVRHLSPKLRIGLCFQPLSSQMEAKTGDVQEKFEHLCMEAGGVSYVQGSPTKCRIMLVQQYIYSDSFVASFRADIVAEEIWGMLTLASMGLDAHDAFLKQFGVSRLTVPDKGLANFLLEARHARSRYHGLEMTEVGLPFQKYPVFEEFAVDWVVAAPTLFSFHTERDKQAFLRNVLKLMKQIPERDVIVYKSHNGNEKDYFTPRLYEVIARMILRIPSAEVMLEGFIQRLPQRLQYHLNKVLTAMLHLRVTRRAIAMIKFTPLADMSIEAFLPGVRKGVIGGLSNTIWGALYFGLRYYNCVDESSRSGSSELLNKSSENLLSLNLKYFGLPFCNGDLSADIGQHSITKIKNLNSNLIDLILLDLEDDKRLKAL
jgi:hypothetical protein